MKPVVHRLRRAALFEKLGPGLITGAADDDPSGIATYSQAGAQFGVNMLWIMFFLYPLMSTMQLISARIGRVTGHGLAANMRRIFPPWAVTGLVALLFIANTVNIGGARYQCWTQISRPRPSQESACPRSSARKNRS